MELPEKEFYHGFTMVFYHVTKKDPLGFFLKVPVQALLGFLQLYSDIQATLMNVLQGPQLMLQLSKVLLSETPF